MLAYRHRAGFRQAGAHAIGAGFALAPDRADAQAFRGDLARERVGGDQMHDHAIGIGQHHRHIGVGELLVERGHLQPRAVGQVAEALAALAQFAGGKHRRDGTPLRIEPVFAQAAGP
ncbi:hypothetical protein ACU4GD_09540 [Cupriavidus basilensis]